MNISNKSSSQTSARICNVTSVCKQTNGRGCGSNCNSTNAVGSANSFKSTCGRACVRNCKSAYARGSTSSCMSTSGRG